MTARQAVRTGDWPTVATCANQILQRDRSSAEGYFLSGLVEKASNRHLRAAQTFEQALALDPGRYDAAIELADLYSIARRNGETAALLHKYEPFLDNSPVYLDMAGKVYTDIGLPQKAWPLFKKASELQPGVDLFQANLAACSVYLGKIEEAAKIYRSLLYRFPNHRRNHYRLARLQRATDRSHIELMQQILRESDESPDKNIFLYYAIGKELEDLGEWEEAFQYYHMGGNAVCSVAKYDVAEDIALIDRMIEVCNAAWLRDTENDSEPADTSRTPIFVVGLPRTGTTLVERIISSHSNVQSLGETQFLQMVLRRESGIASTENMTPAMIEAVAGKDMGLIARGYMDAATYRLGDEALFIDKFPFNFLYVGFIARAWPNTRIVYVVRNPMDACFSMYKAVFTWAYKFSYSLEGLGRYYVAHDRLLKHWQATLGDRLIEVSYEDLVNDQEQQTRLLLGKLGLEFEQNCLDFERNEEPSTTASSVQVRQKVHSDSVGRWTRFARQLQPLREYLENAGIHVG